MGFALGLVLSIYPGDGRGMRLSMVSIGPDGRAQQHPDWASRAGMIDDVLPSAILDACVEPACARPTQSRACL